jgi:hypothetical protein
VISDAFDRVLDWIEYSRVGRAVAGGVGVLLVIGLIWYTQSLIRMAHEDNYLKVASQYFPESTSDHQKLEAGYHACHWLQAQDESTFDRPYGDGNGTRFDKAVDLLETQPPRPLADEFAVPVAWRQLCRDMAQDKLHFRVGWGGD